jgi:hypothetical protein
MPPVKVKKRSPPHEIEPSSLGIPHIYAHETPTAKESADLMEAVALGLSVEAASAYSSVPSPYVRNWIARGREEELKPFNVDVYTDKGLRAHHQKFHDTVTVPCYNLWMVWRKTRAKFLMKCVGKMAKSKDWHAQAWLLERIEPGAYIKPNAPTAIKRDLLPYEKEVEAAIVEDPDAKEVVQIILPGNGR